MWKEWSGSGQWRYAHVIARVKARLLNAAHSEGHETEEWMDRVIEGARDEVGMKRSGVVKVLRHALTGRKVSAVSARLRWIFLWS